MSDLFQHAIERRDRGMALAADAEEDAQPEFKVEAYAAIERIARRQLTVHVDDVLKECPVRPHHPNAWGSVWMMAMRNKLIERTSATRVCTVDPKKNGHRYPLYRSLVALESAHG